MPKPASEAAANYREPDFEKIMNKPITPLQEHFLDWVLAKTGITFPTKKEEAAFAEGIRIGTALRGVHQASPENQERLAQAKADAEAAAKAEAAAPAPAKAAKATPTATKAAPAKVAKTTKAAPAKATPAKATPEAARPPAKKATKRAPAKAAVTVVPDDEAPF
jgi:hypothetical protein